MLFIWYINELTLFLVNRPREPNDDAKYSTKDWRRKVFNDDAKYSAKDLKDGYTGNRFLVLDVYLSEKRPSLKM